ncbi:MAG TPA: ACT domain-containing protein [Spirochaetia bacterium]|nr:ACT domain-containing protein [Spirochaetia bacterium]
MNGESNGLPNTIVKLMVRNHPGAMSHITGLFSRRGFNLEGILCAPVDGGADSAMYLVVRNDERLEQIVKQLNKLYDVKSVGVVTDHIWTHRFKEAEESTLFGHLEALLEAFEAEEQT